MLTPEQIQNWRNMLLATIGPYANLMTDQQIQAYRDRLQAKLDGESQGDEDVKQKEAANSAK